MIDTPFALAGAALVALAVWSLGTDSRVSAVQPAYAATRPQATAASTPGRGIAAAFGHAAAVRNLIY